MADAQANIGIGVDTSQALAAIRQLQREISAFHTSMAKGGALANAESMRLSQNLVNTINSSGKFSAGMTRISSSTESFTNALEKNKLSMGQYFRFAGGASRSFGKMFSREFNTINRVATERVKDLQTQYISMGRDANGALQAIKVRPLALDMNNLGTKVQMVAQKQQLFNQLLRQGSTNLLNFGKNTQWAGRQLMVGFTIPLTIFGTLAAREFQKLEEQAVNFRRVYGDMFTTDADTEKALTNVRELADEFTKYGIAVEKTVGLAAKVAQMGNVGTDLTEQVTQATRLAVLGGMEQEEALDTTISLTNAFGIAAEDLADKIAFLNAAENQTILAIEDFNTAIPLSGSVVRQLGGDVEDLAVLLTAMREGGINASQAGNALKSSLGRLIAPSRNAKETLGSFGIDVLGIVDNNAGNLMGTINTLAYALEELDPLSRARSIEALFGKFQFARMSTMFQNIVKDGSQANKVLGLTANSTEELAIIAERELSKVEQSPAFKLKKQMEQLKASLAPIGEEFVKAVGPLIEFGTRLLKSFNNLGDGGKQFVVILTTLAGVVAPAALMMFGLIANGVANLVKFIALLGRGFARLSGQSRILGTGTDYMTQQQIEAAAVAASLQQSHTRLIQVFTAEASAVRGLATSYRQAIIAQSAFRTTGAAGFGAVSRPKGYASGGLIKGPGTSTSDSIIARVSKDEFIVNAAATKESLPFLEALNSGKIKVSDIPGFSTGGSPGSPIGAKQVLPNLKEGSVSGVQALIDKLTKAIDPQKVQDGLSQLTNAAITTADALKKTPEFQALNRERNLAEIPDHFAHVGSGNPTTASELAPQMQGDSAISQRVRDISTFAPETQMDVKHGWGLKTAGLLNIEMANKGAPAQELLDDFDNTDVKERWAKGVAQGGGDIDDPEIQQDLVEFDNEIKRILAEKLKDNADALVVDTQAAADALPEDQRASAIVMESVEQEASESIAGTKLGGIRETAKKTPTQLRYILTDELEEQRQLAETGAMGPEAQAAATRQKKHIQQKSKKQDPSVSPKDLPSMPYTEAGRQDSESWEDGATQAAPKDVGDIARSLAGRNSPHPEAFPDGADDATDYLRGQESVLGAQSDPYAGSNLAPPLPGLAPPPPPEVGYMPDDNSLRSRVRGLGKRVADKAADSSVGKFAGKKLAQASGNAITDSKGQVYYDPNEDPDAWAGQMTAKDREFRAGLPGGKDYTPDIPDVAGGAPLPVRVVDGFEMDPQFQETMESGQIQTEDLSETLAKNVETTDQNTNTSKEVIKQDKAQKRQARAGKALGVLGTATMVAGMSTQVDGVVGETAQKLVGPMAALSGIAPMLMALPAPIAALVAVIGAGVALWFLYNKAMDAAYDKTYELTRALGTGADAMNKFAEFAGTVGASEKMERRREARLSQFATAPGKKTFGSAFVESDEGAEFVNNVKESVTALGRDNAIQAVFQQMGTAISQGIMTPEQARSIVGNLGIQMGDLAFSAEVNAQLVSLVGANGENLLTEPMQIAVALNQAQTDTLQQNVEDYEADRSVLAMEEVGVLESSQRVGSDVLKYLGLVNPVLASLWGNLVETDEAYDDAIAAEKQRRIDSGEVEGWWAETMLRLTPDTTIANEMLQNSLGSVSAGMQNALEGQQAAVDQIRMASEDKIAKAIEEGADYSEVAKLREEEAEAIQEAIDAIRQQTLDTVAFVAGLSESDQKTVQDQQRQRIQEATPEGVDKGAQGTAFDRLFKDSELGFEKNFVISSAYESGQLSFPQFLYLSELEDEQKEIYYHISTNLGAGEAGQIVEIAKQIDDETIRAEFEMSFKGLEGDDLTKAIAVAEEINRLGILFGGDLAIPVNFMLNNEEDMDAFVGKLEQLELDSVEGGFDANIELFTSIFGAEEVEAAQRGILANQAEFDALPDEMQLQYGAYFTLFMDMAVEDGALMDMAEAATGLTGEEAVAAWVMDILPAMGPDRSTFGGSEDNDTGSGGGQKEGFDELLVGLRNVRQATIDMKRGWDGMQESLQKFLDSGSIGFNGLSNQMRKFGVGENLIERIIGMDPDEYEKRKHELFTFDQAGNITGTTQKLNNMGLAMNKLAIGEYINSQQSFIENTNNQFTAMQKLTAAGLDFVEAYEMVQDQVLATAIAKEVDAERTAELIRITQMMAGMREKYNRVSEEEQAAKAVRQTNKEFNNRVAVLNKLSSQQGKYTDEEINAILNDSNLSTLLLDPSIDSKSLTKALEIARRAADLELQIKVTTEEGKAGLFNELVGGIQDEFNRQEAKIDIDFRFATRDDQNIVNEAQNQIAAIQYQIDDYEAQLKGIEDQEEVINEKYDDRYKALEEVAAANERIQRIRSAELDIADALSRGDIAAAARAQQDLRAAEAQSRAESQKEMLQRQQEAEIARVRSASEASREEIEDRIKALQDKIFGVEENALEPAQERLRIAEYEKQLQVDALEVSGKTRDVWDQIASATDIATQNTEEFAKNIERALALYEHFVNGAELDADLFGGELKAQAKELGAVFKEPPPPPPSIPPSFPPSFNSGSGAQTIDRGIPVEEVRSDVAVTINSYGVPVNKHGDTDFINTNTSSAKSVAPTPEEKARAEAYRARADAAIAKARELMAEKNSNYNYNPWGTSYAARGGMIVPKRMNIGGMAKGYSVGGKVLGYAAGGYSLGSDNIPAMLTPGEFVVRKRAVQNFGVENLEKLNGGEYSGGSVYNYSLAVNVKSDADPERIARTVMKQIQRVDSQRVRGNRI